MYFMKITDLEDKIDVEYDVSDVVRVEDFGILMKDYRVIHFKECHNSFLGRPEGAFGLR